MAKIIEAPSRGPSDSIFKEGPTSYTSSPTLWERQAAIDTADIEAAWLAGYVLTIEGVNDMDAAAFGTFENMDDK